MGKVEQRRVRLVCDLGAVGAEAEDFIVYCPFLAGRDPATRFWLGSLAWHDCNAQLLATLPPATAPSCPVYVGVFGVDPFRRDEDMFAAIHAARLGGVINLPSVSVMDGGLAAILDSFDLGVQREVAFLRRARDAGLRIAGCAADAAVADAMVQAGADFIVAHAGPPMPGKADSGRAAAARLRRRYGDATPVMSAGELLATLTG